MLLINNINGVKIGHYCSNLTFKKEHMKNLSEVKNILIHLFDGADIKTSRNKKENCE